MGVLDQRAGLSGKSAIIIGAAQRIGRAVALSLAEAGVDIACCDIDEAGLRNLEAAVAPLSRRTFFARVDIRDPAQIESFFKARDKTFDSLDILINNVGGGRYVGPFAGSTPADWADDIQASFGYVLTAVSQALPRMQRRGKPHPGGSIVNLTTVEAYRGRPNRVVYASAKAALAHFSRSLAVELGPVGIRINNVAPDQTDSPPQTPYKDYQAYPPEILRRLVEEAARMKIPAGRAGRDEEIANAVLFLASDLSSYVTGTTIHADGGTFASSGWFRWPLGQGFRSSAPLPIVERLLDPPQE